VNNTELAREREMEKCGNCILPYIPSDICFPGEVLVDHMVGLSLVIQGASTLFSTVVALIYISTNSD
jgi:hypothetical protein